MFYVFGFLQIIALIGVALSTLAIFGVFLDSVTKAEGLKNKNFKPLQEFLSCLCGGVALMVIVVGFTFGLDYSISSCMSCGDTAYERIEELLEQDDLKPLIAEALENDYISYREFIYIQSQEKKSTDRDKRKQIANKLINH